MASLTFEASLPHPDDTDKLGARLADAVSKEAGAVAGHGLAVRLEGNLGAGKTSLVRAMLRRREEFTPDILRCGDISLNLQNCELSGNGQSFTLPKLEFKMMELLLLNQGIYLSSEDLLVKVWGYDTNAELGIVWVYISYLRKRLTALNANVEIRAKRNTGYMLEAMS